MTKFIGVRKDNAGKITHLKTDEGQIVSLPEARKMAKEGWIDSLTDLHADGSWEIKDELQFSEGNNLGKLPKF